MSLNTSFSKAFTLRLPVIMAPMFLVSNEAMMRAALDEGIMGVFPSLNYRKEGELQNVLQSLEAYRREGQRTGLVGVNLIVQKTNPLFEKHLRICVEEQVPFYITSLGNPDPVIRAAHSYGGKVYCDVTNLKHAEKCAGLGCDGFIAVTEGAGGHAGPHPLHILVPALRDRFPGIPVIAAGGIATGQGLVAALALGASGVSMGTRFIASTEAEVNPAYKQAIVDAGMDDIMMTERLSGTPCAVIGTAEARRLGPHQSGLERWLSRSPRTKKYFKMLVQFRGMQRLEKAIRPGDYSRIWSAGQSVEFIHHILPCKDILGKLEHEARATLDSLKDT